MPASPAPCRGRARQPPPPSSIYSEGIKGVGVDRIVSTANVTLATFYRHFPSKQDLVVAYLQAIHDSLAERAATTADGLEA
jgi:AcrR family transcriptional regulator